MSGQARQRDVGEIHWLLFWPEAPAGNPYWQDATNAAEALMATCLGQLQEWGVSRQQAGGELPVRGVYGVPDQWPHISALYERAGFAPPDTRRSSIWPGFKTFSAVPTPRLPDCRCAGRSE